MSKHTAAILSFIASFGDNCTTSDIAEGLKLSTSRTRELLAAEVKAKTIDRFHADVDGCKVLVYHIKDGTDPTPQTEKAEDIVAPKADKPTKKAKQKPAAPAAKKTKAPKTPKEKKARRKASGAGKPNAKKVVNPQQTLDLKKAMIERNRGKMVWQNRVWVITVGGESHTMKSRDLAGYTLEGLATELGLTV